MWIFTTAGFISAVQDYDDLSGNTLLVRARDRASIQTVADGVELIADVPAPSVVVGGGTDYPYRIRVGRAEFAAWLGHEVMNYLTYGNFKSAAKDSLGTAAEDVLSRVWVTLHGLTDDAGWSAVASWATDDWEEYGDEGVIPAVAAADDNDGHR